MKTFSEYVSEWFEEFVNSNDLNSLCDALIEEKFRPQLKDDDDKREFLLKIDADEIYEKLFYSRVLEGVPETDEFLTDMFMQYVKDNLDSCYYDFAKELVTDMAAHSVNYDKPLGFFDDLYCGGCASGLIGMFIYNSDCLNFYRKHCNEMEEYREELQEGFGPLITSNNLRHYVWMCWLCYEEIAHQICSALFPDEW